MKKLLLAIGCIAFSGTGALAMTEEDDVVATLCKFGTSEGEFKKNVFCSFLNCLQTKSKEAFCKKLTIAMAVGARLHKCSVKVEFFDELLDGDFLNVHIEAEENWRLSRFKCYLDEVGLTQLKKKEVAKRMREIMGVPELEQKTEDKADNSAALGDDESSDEETDSNSNSSSASSSDW